MTREKTTTAKEETVSHNPVVLALAWAAVGLPLLWGVAQTIKKTLSLFS
jgi:hypothetical protein